MKIYTKSGDKGTTSLLNGERVPKTHQTMEAIGAVDELNSSIGIFVASLDTIDKSTVISVMHKLFDIGSILASSEGDIVPSLSGLHIELLEKEIDRLTDSLPKLSNFILPTGNIHLSRSVCRRAEREVIRVGNSLVVKYLNRLSDYLFTLARRYGEQLLWTPEY